MHSYKAVAAMSETWKEFEGKIIDEKLLLVRCLGGSAHGAAFLADEIGDGGPTVIKLIAADPQQPDAQLARLRAMTGLNHPNLLRILSVGRYEAGNSAFLYLRMEYADENLAQLLPVRKLTVEEAHQLLRPLLDVLRYLHSQGFVHGHIQPSNLLAIGDQIKLSCDPLYPAGELARLDSLSIYTAPEATTKNITTAADAWSLGVMLMQAMTGETPNLNAGQLDPEIPDTLPPPFHEIVRNCLRRDPQQRWTIGEIASALQPRPVAARAPAAARPVPSQKTSARRFGLWTGVAALFIAAFFAGFALIEGGSGDNAASSTPQQPAQASAPQSSQPNRESQAQQPATGIPQATQDQAAGPPRRAVVPSALKEQATVSEQDLIVHREMPNVSQRALNTITGTVRVGIRLQVAPSGNVAQASFDSHGPSNYFAERAMRAAKLWKFAPQEAGSQWQLRFQYRRSGTTIIPEPVNR